MNKLQTCLGGMVALLTITCIGLIIGLARLNDREILQPEQKQKNQVAAKPEPEPEPAPDLEPKPDSGGEKRWERDVRLPSHLLPLHYDLYLHPDLASGLFSGRVTIAIESTAPTNYFLVHTKYLDISESSLQTSLGDTIPILETFEYTKNEFWVVVVEGEVGAGNYSLSLQFQGNLSRGITGFYKSVYTNGRGDQVPIATSKFQPTYARQAFPCFDEPSFKSTFSTVLVRPSERYIALSNMPVEREEENSPTTGLTTVTFQKSVPMVTYLACFIVCDFEYEEKLTSTHQTKFRVYAKPQQKDRVRYALDIGANITDFFTDYYNISYPLPKQDMIAIPDFVSGAMEHWGLITYRETNLLFDERESSSANKQRVATVVSHELAHQWFGNLVTLQWWDDLWLNEGFASYMEYKGVSNYHPDWDMESQFLTMDLHRVMDLDSTVNSHPIVQPVNHPDQITEIFDRISYAKGASVLRMLEQFLGPELFRQGVHLFLSRFQYRNAVTDDLWAAMVEVSEGKLNIKAIMDSWTRQMGYPVLQVTRSGTSSYRVQQERYLTDSSLAGQGDTSPYGYRWDVPVTWISEIAPNSTELQWLGKEEAMIEVMLPRSTAWIKFNVGQFGYYRVNYPPEGWDSLADLLIKEPTTLGPMDRASLLNDAFSLAESGHIGYDTPLSMTRYLEKETHLVPWDTVYDKLVAMGGLLESSPSYPLFRSYVVDLVIPHYDRLGWRDEGSHIERTNRYNILALACKYGHTPCNTEAGNRFTQWIQDPTLYIPANLRSLTYRHGMASEGDPDTWEHMFRRYLAETNAQEKRKLLYGLAQIREPWVLRRFLNLAKNESNVRSQDYFAALSYISANPVGNSIVWNFLQAEWNYLVDRFTLNDRYLGRFPTTVSAKFSTQFKLDQLKRFFLANPEAGAGARARKQAVEQVENNIRWLEKHNNVIQTWLETRDSR